MARKSLASRARRLNVCCRFCLALGLWLAAWPAGAQDQNVAAADRAFAEGARLWKEGTEASRLRAIEKYQEALALRRAMGDSSGEAHTIAQIGYAYNGLSKYREAVEHWEQALTLRRALGQSGEEGLLLLSIGLVYNRLDEKERALDRLKQALSLLRAAGKREREAYTFGAIGNVYNSIGDKQRALDYWRQALPIRRELGDQPAEANALYMIGYFYDAVGEKQKAIDHLRQALSLQRKLGDKQVMATTLYWLGLTYDSILERRKAVECFKEGLELRTAEGYSGSEGSKHNSLGNFYEGLGEKQKAIDHYTRALNLLEAEKNYVSMVNVLRNLALTYGSIGERVKALECFKRAAAMVQLGGNRRIQGRFLADMGKLQCEIGDYEQALEQLNKAVPILRDSGELMWEVYALHWAARAERGRGDLQAARDRIAEATDRIEKLRATVNSPELRSLAFTRAQEIYEFEIDTLMQLHKRRPAESYAASALRANEQARAREMLAMLAEARAEIRKGVEPDLLARERSLREQLDAQANRLTFLLNSARRDEAQIETVRRDLDALQTEYQQTQEEIRRVSPRYAALTEPQPLSLVEIQRQVLDDDTLLLEYALGEERSYLWAVTTDSMTSYELPRRTEIEQAARRVYGLLTARNQHIKFETADEKKARVAQADAEYPAAAAALAQIVLGPVAGQLNRKRLLIVSDGALQYVPFAALPVPSGEEKSGRQGDKEKGRRGDKEKTEQISLPPCLPVSPSPLPPVSPSPCPSVSFRPMIIDHEIVSLPSASTLAVLRRELEGRTPAPKSVAVLADPVFDRGDDRFKVASAASPAALSGVSIVNAMAKPGAAIGTRGAELEPELEPEIESDLVKSAEDIGLAGQGFHLSRLPFTRKEAQAILSLAPKNARLEALDFAASQGTVFNPELSQYRYVHFATHGLLNSLRPELSGIVLSLVNERGELQDGFLRAHEVFDLDLPVELVVLSACVTGLGKEIKGEGLVGLTRGFMYAGAARVMVSLWDVNDQATAQLMANLYQGILGKRRLSPAAALREAQVAFWRDKRWQSPYYWAAFTLQGEPR